MARKLGWVQCCNPKTIENGKIVDCFGWSKGGSHFHEAFPDYCHEIKAAWEIVEHLTKNGEWYRLENNDGLWHFGLVEVCGDDFYLDQEGIADTAPKSICLAFLMVGKC